MNVTFFDTLAKAGVHARLFSDFLTALTLTVWETSETWLGRSNRKPESLYTWLQLAALPFQQVQLLEGATDRPLVSKVMVWGAVTGTDTLVELAPAAIVNATVANVVPPELLAMTLPVRPEVLAEQVPLLSAPVQALTVTDDPLQVTPAPE